MMNFDLIFRNGSIITPQGIIQGDLAVAGGKIVAIGDGGDGVSGGAGTSERGSGNAQKNISKQASGNAKKEIDATGLFILPGAIDMHVHFRDPGFPEKEDFASGSAAAAAGGITTVIDMPNTNPPTVTCAALEEKRRIAAAKSLVNYGFFFGLTDTNLDEVRAAKNIAGVKVYMGSSTGDLLVRDTQTLEKLFELGKFVIVHAEDEKIIQENAAKYAGSEDPSVHSLIRSPRAAYEAVKSILHLAKKHNARVHITHVSTADEVAELRKFKGSLVSADATPHHLFLTQAAYGKFGNFVKVNPPLRTEEDRIALWKGLHEGVIQAVASDHAPHEKAEKEKSYSRAPAGVPGAETLLPLLLDAVNHGELSLRDVVRMTAENPARLLKIKNKGRLEVGADADFVVVNMEQEISVGGHLGAHSTVGKSRHGELKNPGSAKTGAKFFTKCGWSPFAGRKLKGWPVITVVGGQVAFENETVNMACKGREIEV